MHFIKQGVGKIRADRALLENASLYRSVIEQNPDLLCRFLPGGKIRFVNDSYANFTGSKSRDSGDNNFISLLPEDERENIVERIHNLSPLNPEILIEHAIRKVDGSFPRIQWNYRAIFNTDGDIIEYQTAGRLVHEPGKIVETHPSQSVKDAVSTIQTPGFGTEPEDEWKTFTKTIDTLESPVFAIDKTGVVNIWNKAMEQLTGVPSKEMVGKGNREYAIPFFGEPRPMLVDYIVISTDKRQSGKFPGIKRMGNTFIGEMEKVKIREKPMFLWGKGTAIHDEKGMLIAAIETITVAEQQQAGQITGEFRE